MIHNMKTSTALRNIGTKTTLFSEDNISSENIFLKEGAKTIFYEDEIKILLDFYKEDSIFLKSLEYRNKKFYFYFKKFIYPYFKTELKHLTREQTIAFVTQAAYLFGIINNLYDNNWNYQYDKFCYYMKNEKMGFTEIRIKYRRFIENKENALLVFNSVTYKKHNNKLFGEIDFELEKYCVGIIKFFIDL
jgi:hypothetical protein